MKRIYLASPYSHKDKRIERKREKQVTEIAALMTRDYGYSMFLPITQSYQMCKVLPELGGSFEKWKKIDLFEVRHSTEVWVVMLDGWKESIGVKAEIKLAKRLKKPVRYFDYNRTVMKYKEVTL